MLDSKRDVHWQRVFLNVPAEVLRDLAKSTPEHRLEKLYKDKEILVDEVFRVCSAQILRTLEEEFPGPDNFCVWFYHSDIGDASMVSSLRKLDGKLKQGIKPNLEAVPKIYRVEEFSDRTIFRLAAKDTEQQLSTGFDEKTTVELVNYYTVVLERTKSFTLLVFGPYAKQKAKAVSSATAGGLNIVEGWQLLTPKRGQSRDFYEKLKRALKAFLIETKRHDPTGNYETVALESKHGKPDLEDVPNFQKNYAAADSYYDVLQFTCTNRLGLKETTHVKFGYPHGRFAFRTDTSLSAVLHFENKVRGLLL